MKKYTTEERFDVLNRHYETLHIEKGTAFTILTQHFDYKNIEDVADTILHYEKFNEIYGKSDYFEIMSELYKKRKEIFFSENRILNDEETEHCVKIDEDYQIYLQKCSNEAQL
jgi:hypothetical protein